MNKYKPLKSFKTKKERGLYVREQMQAEGLYILEDYKGNSVPMKCRILIGPYRGYLATVTWNNFIKGKRPDFRGLLDKEKFLRDKFEEEGYTVVSIPETLSVRDKVNLISPEGHEWSVSYDTFRKGVRCPLDSDRSWGERCVSTILKENKIPFSSQKTIRHEDGTRQYLDFYVEYLGKKFDIEYNGRQHYEEERINQLFNSLEAQQRSDRKKEKYCKENEITQIIIPYTIRESQDIALVLSDFLPVEVRDYTIESYRYNEKAVVEFYKKHTLKETAAHFGICVETVKKTARRHKFKKKGNYGTDEKDILSFYSVHSAQKTADHFGVTKHQVYAIARKYSFKKGGSLT